MPSLALDPNCRADKDTRVATAENDGSNLSCSQRLYVVADRAVLTEIVLPTLPASGQAGLRYHRQVMPPKNIQANADEN